MRLTSAHFGPVREQNAIHGGLIRFSGEGVAGLVKDRGTIAKGSNMTKGQSLRGRDGLDLFRN